MDIKHNIVGWFEIPVSDMDRAISFYENVLGLKLQRNQVGGADMAWFPWLEAAVGSPGALICHKEYYKPSPDGVLIYLSSQTGDINDELARIEAAGGKVVQAKTLITEDIGYMGVFIDTEGNRVALHSRK